MTDLDNYGELTALKFKAKNDLTFQTANANSTVIRATDGSGDQIITIAAQSGNSSLLTSESSLAAAKVDINGATAATDPQDADEAIVYDASATSNKKMTLANLKTYFSAGSGLPSGSNNQIITYSGTTAQAVAMSGDISIVANGTTAVGSNKITTAMLQDDCVDADKLAADAVVNASVASGAAIAYSKLALSDSIVAGDLTTDCVVTAKIQNNAVNASKIGANQVTNVKIAALAGVTAGTVSATKLMLPDASKDLSGFRNLTSTGSTQSNDFLVGTSKWKIVVDGSDNLLFQYWNGSAWVTKQVMSNA